LEEDTPNSWSSIVQNVGLVPKVKGPSDAFQTQLKKELTEGVSGDDHAVRWEVYQYDRVVTIEVPYEVST
jgi:hypothetical protein